MSVFRDRAIPCPHCGVVARREVALSVAAPRRPDVRAAILADTFQRWRCDACKKPQVVEGPLSYIDFDRREFIGAYPAAWLASWRSVEQELVASFHSALEEFAPPLVQAIAAEGFFVRAVFGLTSLREKILAHELGIDDHALEAVKLDAERAGVVSLGAAEICLASATAEKLVFTLGAGEFLDIPRARYEAIASDSAWAATRAAVGPERGFVDRRRLYVEGNAPRV